MQISSSILSISNWIDSKAWTSVWSEVLTKNFHINMCFLQSFPFRLCDHFGLSVSQTKNLAPSFNKLFSFNPSLKSLTNTVGSFKIYFEYEPPTLIIGLIKDDYVRPRFLQLPHNLSLSCFSPCSWYLL